MRDINRKASLFIAVGTVGIAAYQLVFRSIHSSVFAKDSVHGLWVGVFLGLEIFGIYLFLKAKRQPSA